MSKRQQHPSAYQVFVEGVALPVQHVVSAECQDGIDLLDELTVKVRNARMSYTMGPNIFRGKKISLYGGYQGLAMDTLFGGYIGAAWPSGDDAGDIITLKALPVDISHLWHVKRTYTLFEGFTRHSEVVRDVVSRYHPQFRTDLIEFSPAVQGVMFPVQHGETDIEFCKRMAREAGGYEFIIKGNDVLFRKPDTSGAPKITYRLGVNIKSYSFQEDDSILKAAVEYYTGGVAGNKTKPESGSVQTSDTQMEDEGRSGTSQRQTDASKNTKCILLAGMDPQLAELVAKGKTKDPASLEQTLTITAPGDINATAGTNAKVEGLGWIDGVWYQRSVTHTFDDSGYGISVECSNHV